MIFAFTEFTAIILNGVFYQTTIWRYIIYALVKSLENSTKNTNLFQTIRYG
jgi:hypothetical protein